MDDWRVVQGRFERERVGHWGSIFTVANGYFGSRGVDEECLSGDPSTYVAGSFTEDDMGVDTLPNTPNWLVVELEVEGDRFDIEKAELLEYRREYDLREGVVYRDLKFRGPGGKVVRVRSERFVSQDDYHLGVLRYCVSPVNFSGRMTLRTGFDCDARFRGVNYLEIVGKGGFEDGVFVHSETTESRIGIAEAAATAFSGGEAEKRIVESGAKILVEYSFEAEKGREYGLDKFVSIFTSRDEGGDITEQARAGAVRAREKGYDSLKSAHISRWGELWKECDIKIEGDSPAQLAIRFCMFHLISASHPDDDRVSLGAKLLSGDFYRHHVFWDTDLFMLPFFSATLPGRASNMAMYRYRTLDGARRKAAKSGHKGACYAWESSDTGDEVSPEKWIDDDGVEHLITCWKQEIHSTCDVAMAMWEYYVTTGDRPFLFEKCFEILVETARFWVSRAEQDENGDLLSIRGVTGPDENHQDVDNSAYTNYLAKWNILKALEVAQIIKDEETGLYEKMMKRLRLSGEEMQGMRRAAEAIKVPYDEEKGTFIQFDGFEDLKPVGPKEAVERVADERGYQPLQVVKQADVIMLMYLFRERFSRAVMKASWDYYVPKTAHNSSLSACTHSIVASILGMRKEAYRYFKMSAEADLGAVRPDTEHGLHGAAMGGTWKAVVFGFAGVIFLEEKVKVDPSLPEGWERLQIPLKWRGASFVLDIGKSSFRVINNSRVTNLYIESGTTEYVVGPQGRETIKAARRSLTG